MIKKIVRFIINKRGKPSSCHCGDNLCFDNKNSIDINLSLIKPGEQVRVLEIVTPCHAFKTRLMDLGIRKGKRITLVRNAPLGDPMHISVGSHDITLRKNEAKFIRVEKMEESYE